MQLMGNSCKSNTFLMHLLYCYLLFYCWR